MAEIPGHKASSDYGDDDFDDETLLELDASFLGQTDDRTLVVSAENSSQTAAPAPVQKAVDDEFGDLDDDFFEGAEDLVAQVEAKHMSQTTTLQRQWQDTPAKAVEEDDEFGDLDDIDFDEVELAATQAAASRLFSSNVRTAG